MRAARLAHLDLEQRLFEVERSAREAKFYWGSPNPSGYYGLP
jgi:hypothetical protein